MTCLASFGPVFLITMFHESSSCVLCRLEPKYTIKCQYVSKNMNIKKKKLTQGQCLKVQSFLVFLPFLELVFKGPVYRTRKKTKTGPNRTDQDRTASCGCVHFRLMDRGCGTGCNWFCPQPVGYKVGLKNIFQMSLKSQKMIKI